MWYNTSTEDEVINASIIDFPDAIWERSGDWDVVAKLFFLIPILVISVPGNGFVIYLMTIDRSLLTSINLFICNLVSVDMITNLFFPWLVLCDGIFQNYVLGYFLCKVGVFLRSKHLTQNLSKFFSCSVKKCCYLYYKITISVSKSIFCQNFLVLW